MRALTQKQNQPQQQAAPGIAGGGSAASCQPHQASYWQQMLEDQSAQQLRQKHERSLTEHAGSGDVEQNTVPSSVGDVVNSSGIPLDPAVRASAEARLGFDFSRVRVHADEDAAHSAKAVQARAYTVGSHIVFARGEYQPHIPEGAQMILHELVHVAQQGQAVGNTPIPRSMTRPDGACEREARSIAGHGGIDAAPPRIVSRLGPMLARFDTTGAELQKERSEALRQGRIPDEPVQKPLDPALFPEPKVPEPTRPGDPSQQEATFADIYPAALWYLPRIHDRMETIAAETEARERAATKPGGEVKRTAENLMRYWHERFAASIDYILFIRGGDKRAKLLKQLRAEEDKLVKSIPAGRPTGSASPDSAEEEFREKHRVSELRAQVENLRRTFRDKWQKEVDLAADRFVILASNEALFLTVKQAATPVTVYGIPEWIEGTVVASANKETVAKDSTPVAPSVITFMKAVQQESGLKALASNYTDHEKHSPYLGDIKGVGKYSFDVHLDGIIGANTEGFYEREPLIKFLLAVERASTTTGIAWIALYNDFEVAKTVNEKLGKRRIGFSGGGSAGPRKEGSIHHGPAPYLLHIHFNIMPMVLAGVYVTGKKIAPYITQ